MLQIIITDVIETTQYKNMWLPAGFTGKVWLIRQESKSIQLVMNPRLTNKIW